MVKLSNLLNKEDGFQVKLRCDNYFDSEEYNLIRHALAENSKLWKYNNSVPLDDVVALMSLVDQLAGGNRFYNEETAVKAENACIEIQEMIIDLLY